MLCYRVTIATSKIFFYYSILMVTSCVMFLYYVWTLLYTLTPFLLIFVININKLTLVCFYSTYVTSITGMGGYRGGGGRLFAPSWVSQGGGGGYLSGNIAYFTNEGISKLGNVFFVRRLLYRQSRSLRRDQLFRYAFKKGVVVS